MHSLLSLLNSKQNEAATWTIE